MTVRAERPVYSRIKRKLVLHYLPAGNPIVVRELEDELSASQVPIREALIELAAEDLADFVPGKGFFLKANDLTEILGNFDLMQFLLVDAANYICSKSALQGHLSQFMLRHAPCAAGNHHTLDMFDSTTLFLEALNQHYRRPHVDVLGRAVYRCCYLLHVDANLHGENLRASAQEYLSLILQGDLGTIEQGSSLFWKVRKDRLAETLAYASNLASAN